MSNLVCLSCTAPSAPGHSRCAPCMERARKKRAAKVAAGICIRCSEKATDGTRHCRRHQEYCRQRNRKPPGTPRKARGTSIVDKLNDYDAIL